MYDSLVHSTVRQCYWSGIYYDYDDETIRPLDACENYISGETKSELYLCVINHKCDERCHKQKINCFFEENRELIFQKLSYQQKMDFCSDLSNFRNPLLRTPSILINVTLSSSKFLLIIRIMNKL